MGNKMNNRKKEKINSMGQKFFLEEWEVYDKNNKKSLFFNLIKIY